MKEDRVLERLERIDEDHKEFAKETSRNLVNIEKVLVVQEQNLKTHIKRSDKLEELVGMIKEKDIKPLRRHVQMMEGGLKVIGFSGILVSIVVGIVRLFGGI